MYFRSGLRAQIFWDAFLTFFGTSKKHSGRADLQILVQNERPRNRYAPLPAKPVLFCSFSNFYTSQRRV
jgi:hypothetical protein